MDDYLNFNTMDDNTAISKSNNFNDLLNTSTDLVHIVKDITDMNVTHNNTNFPEIDCENFIDGLFTNIYFKCSVYSMYAIIFVVAVIGNAFVCYIVISSPRMRTVTNYFIMNLAVGDMLISILGVPFTSVSIMKQFWPFGSFLCPVVSYSQALSVFVSAYTMVAISVDRYMVIMWPLKPRISKSIATTVIAIVWIVAGITALPIPIFTKLYQPGSPNETTIYQQCDKYLCTEYYKDVGENYGILYTQVLMFLQYVIPSVVLLFTYTSIASVIWCHQIPGEAENLRDQRMARSKRKMIKMMVTVVVVYSVCWLPFNVLLNVRENISDDVMKSLYFPLHGLAMSHACYNPIIYCYMNARFRDGFFILMQSIPFIGKRCGTSGSESFPHADVGGTDSTVLQRNNTCTTYISMKHTKRTSGCNNYQLPVRSASVMRNITHAHNGTRRISRYPQTIIDEQQM